MNQLFQGMFGKIAPGMCRLSMNGEIAVKTNNGYKCYETKNGRLVNCDQFVFPVGEEFFFLVPTNKVVPGDIILIHGKPRCVVEAQTNRIVVINYEDSTIEQVIPERQIFMGNIYFYGKIVSMFGNLGVQKGKGPGKILKYMMLSEMFKSGGKAEPGLSGKAGNNQEIGPGGFQNLMPLLLMSGGKGNPFEDLFDLDFESDWETEDAAGTAK